MKKRGFTVALIGPDGAGKTTVGRMLERELRLRAKYLYMGVNRDASNRMLPTTRLIRAVKRASGATPDTGGPRDSRELAKPGTRPRRGAVAAARSTARLANQLAEEWYLQFLAWWYVRGGSVVVFDRHFFSDFHAFDIAAGAARSLTSRVHGFVLSHLYPKPDLVVYLDAPPEVLLARKGEGTLEVLARRRDEYLALADVTRHFAVVDATRPAQDVAGDVRELIARYGTTGEVGDAAAPSSPA